MVAPNGRLGHSEARSHLGVEESGGGECFKGAFGATVPEDGAVLLRGAGHGPYASVQLAASPLHLQPVH